MERPASVTDPIDEGGSPRDRKRRLTDRDSGSAERGGARRSSGAHRGVTQDFRNAAVESLTDGLTRERSTAVIIGDGLHRLSQD